MISDTELRTEFTQEDLAIIAQTIAKKAAAATNTP
jgi:hypothetical protein